MLAQIERELCDSQRKSSAERARSLSSTSVPVLAQKNAHNEATASRMSNSFRIAGPHTGSLLQETQSSRGKRRAKFMSTYVDRKHQQRLSRSSSAYQQEGPDAVR